MTHPQLDSIHRLGHHQLLAHRDELATAAVEHPAHDLPGADVLFRAVHLVEEPPATRPSSRPTAPRPRRSLPSLFRASPTRGVEKIVMVTLCTCKAEKGGPSRAPGATCIVGPDGAAFVEQRGARGRPAALPSRGA